MEILNHAFSQALAGNTKLLFVEANSGKGKSRFIKEFTDSINSKALILDGQGLAQGAQRPFQLIVKPAQQITEYASLPPVPRSNVTYRSPY